MSNAQNTLKTLSKYYNIERVKQEHEFWCKACGQGWAIPTRKLKTFIPLRLLNHAYQHEDAREAVGKGDLLGRSTTQRRVYERVFWLLGKINHKLRRGFIVAWDTDFVEEFVERFPEAERTLKIYAVGPNVSPMLSRTAVKAYELGFIKKGSVGNWDARSSGRKTWCRTWRITKKGVAALARRAASGG